MNALAPLFVSFLLCSAALHAQFDWPMMDGGPERRCWAANETSLHPPFQFVYLYPKAAGATNLSCAGGLLMAGIDTSPNAVVALDFTTRDSLWGFSIPGSGGSIDNTPAITAALVLTGGQGGEGLFALNRGTGEVVWSHPLGTLYNRHAIIRDDRVYVIGDSVHCLELATGRSLWTLPGSWQSSPSVDDRYAYIDGDGTTRAVLKTTGETVWTVTGTRAQAMAVDENCVYADRAGQVIAINKSDGIVKWSYDIPGGVSLPNNDGDAVALSDRYLCAVLWNNQDQKGELFALDKNTGAFLWRAVFPTAGIFTPTIANGIVYTIKYPEGKLLGHNVATGALLFGDSSRYYYAQPIVANHSLIAAASEGVVVLRNSPLSAVEESSGKAPEEFPTLDQNYPNPVSGGFAGGNAATAIRFGLPHASFARLSVHDRLGRECALLLAEERTAGTHSVDWRPGNLPAGIYYYRLRAGGREVTRKLVLVK